MVATICFGMGINKADIRYVINIGISSSLTLFNLRCEVSTLDKEGSLILFFFFVGCLSLLQCENIPKGLFAAL